VFLVRGNGQIRAVFFSRILIACFIAAGGSFGYAHANAQCADQPWPGKGIALKRVDARSFDARGDALTRAEAKRFTGESSGRTALSYGKSELLDRGSAVAHPVAARAGTSTRPARVAKPALMIARAPVDAQPRHLSLPQQDTASEPLVMLLAGIGLIGFVAWRRRIGGRAD